MGLRHVFGNTIQLRIIDYLMVNEDSIGKKELTEKCGVSERSLERHLPSLVRNGILQCFKQTKGNPISNRFFYRLRPEIVSKLADLNAEMLK